MMRRIFNVVIAMILLVLSVIPMCIIAIIIKLSTPGPILFIQERVGYKGRVFRLYKFRSMYHNVEDLNPSWTMHNDPRITPVGKMLRRTRLDELPQFINVLLGHMNVVGPRPEQPKIAEQLRTSIIDYDIRHSTLPGITGLAQIRLPSDTTVSDARQKLAVDKEYIQSQSVITDLRIMFRTPTIMFRIR